MHIMVVCMYVCVYLILVSSGEEEECRERRGFAVYSRGIAWLIPTGIAVPAIESKRVIHICIYILTYIHTVLIIICVLCKG